MTVENETDAQVATLATLASGRAARFCLQLASGSAEIELVHTRSPRDCTCGRLCSRRRPHAGGLAAYTGGRAVCLKHRRDG
jgi:hypothetical protein